MTEIKQKIDVSFVMTVYNKEYYLPAVLNALLNQTGLKNPEFIFVDDLSKDRSVEIIKNRTKKINNVTIVEKKVNEGISVSINKGIALARGEYIRMLDSDDILPLDSTEKMLALARQKNADMVYGTFKKTGLEPECLTKEKMPDQFNYTCKSDVLKAVLNGRFTRMGQLIKTAVLKKSGGADERVFIQDESIPLRAALFAEGIIKIFADVVLVPKENGNLSKNTNQLDNDRFFAHYYLLKENQDKLDKKIIRTLYLRALSANWKYVKKNLSYPFLREDFHRYFLAKIFPIAPDFAFLTRCIKRFNRLDNVLRTKYALPNTEGTN